MEAIFACHPAVSTEWLAGLQIPVYNDVCAHSFDITGMREDRCILWLFSVGYKLTCRPGVLIQCIQFFLSQTLLDLKKYIFLLDLSQIFRKDFLCHPLTPNLFAGMVILIIRAELRFLVCFHGNVPCTTLFSQTLFDYNTLVSSSICFKFSGKSSGAIF